MVSLPLGLLTAFFGIWASYNVARIEAANIRLAASLMVSVVEFALFGALVALALSQRHKPQIHKRLLLIATIALTSAGLGRFGFETPFSGLRGGYLLTFLLMAPLIVWDLARLRRLHAATLIGIGASIAVWTFNLSIRRTPEWQGMVAGLVS